MKKILASAVAVLVASVLAAGLIHLSKKKPAEELLGLGNLYNMCGNHPLWRQFLMDRIAGQARGEVDGTSSADQGTPGTAPATTACKPSTVA